MALFSKYHYLSSKLSVGRQKFFGLYQGIEQVGFIAYSNYVPCRKGTVMQMHFNRVVIHPDYVGLGLGEHFINQTAIIVKNQGYDVRSKFSSVPTHKILQRNPDLWRLINIDRNMKRQKARQNTSMKSVSSINRKDTNAFRSKVKTYSYKYIG